MEISSTAADKSPAAGWISCNTCIAGIRGCCVTQGLREGSLFGFLRRGTRGPLWRSTGYTGFPQNNVCPRVFPFFLATRGRPPLPLRSDLWLLTFARRTTRNYLVFTDERPWTDTQRRFSFTGRASEIRRTERKGLFSQLAPRTVVGLHRRRGRALLLGISS